MKNTIKLFAIIALLAVIGLSIAACNGDDDGGGGNPFIGTWSGDGLTVTCKASTWNAAYPGYGSWSGNYTYNGNSANFTETNGSIFGTATVSGNAMTVVSNRYGTFHLTNN